ncbi:hypothetical protein AKJ61_03840 [candidate division MSBL1 archaeon SCGC-AAA259B11]|uniref:Uncharacterized protein n=1 Tax=candidate division MSBL1 archaeon SCGC-AAA259B11 TaxID=1698260 RepID=A0A133U494_9EURY|nr:hypothetical protein AKJ61_03840 [candidate division MSBL1 archaeon SCGC-AAA259B11]
MVPSVKKNYGGEKLRLFGLFGETPEKPDDDENENTLRSRLEEIAQAASEDGISKRERLLHLHIAENIDPALLQECEHLPNSLEDLLRALLLHARAEDATFGQGNHYQNGFNPGLVRHAYLKYKESRFGFVQAKSPKEKRDNGIFIEMETVEKGLFSKHKEFRPIVKVRRSDDDGVKENIESIVSDQTFRTPLHAIPWIEETLDAAKYTADTYVPSSE